MKKSAKKIFLYFNILVLMAGILCFIMVQPARTETEASYRFFFGSFHNHHYATDGADDGGRSRQADGKWKRNPENNALKAFETARKNGCDFYAVTPHTSNISDAAYNDIITAAGEINKKYPGTFLALYGFEWGNLKRGNHVNILGAKEVCRVNPGDFNVFYEEWLPAHPGFAFMQFNHPYLGNTKLNYGIDYYDSIDTLVQKTEPYARTMAVVTSLRQTRFPAYKLHADSINLKYYITALNQGWHIAPIADEDNHRDDWGGFIAPRTVVIAPELTEERIYEAVNNLRVYASEDDETQVTFTACLDESGEKWMGSKIPCPDDAAKATFTVMVDQCQGMDNDPVDEGRYYVEIYGDLDGKGGDPAKVVEKGLAPRGEAARYTLPVKKGQYYFVRVRETIGLDNGANNDDAYTSPIWFE